MGILTQLFPEKWYSDYGIDRKYNTFINSDYVEMMQSLGIDVVPIIYGSETNTTLKAKLPKINGILFPGSSGNDGRTIPNGWGYYTTLERNIWKIL